MMVPLQFDIGGMLITGFQQGAIFALLGIGLTIILGTMEFLNLAHGALYALGAYIGLFIAKEEELTGGLLKGYVSDPTAFGLGLDFAAALIITPIIMFGIGVLMERYVARPFYNRSEVDQLLVTFGLALVVQELLKLVIGTQQFQSYAPSTLFGVNVAGPLTLPLFGDVIRWRLTIILLTIVIIGLTYYLIEQTDFGLIVQAGTEDSEMVELMGIKIRRSYALIFGVGAALAGLAGVIGGTIINLSPAMGTNNALVPAFLTMVVGGAGSVIGAVAAGMLLGMVTAVFNFQAAQWSQIALYIFVAIFILVRPEGIFGSVEVGE